MSTIARYFRWHDGQLEIIAPLVVGHEPTPASALRALHAACSYALSELRLDNPRAMAELTGATNGIPDDDRQLWLPGVPK